MGTPVPVVAVLSRASTVDVETSARNWLLKGRSAALLLAAFWTKPL